MDESQNTPEIMTKINKAQKETLSYDSKSILLSIVCSLFLAPITLHLINSEAGSFRSDLLALIVTLTISGVFIYVLHTIVTERSNFQQQQIIHSIPAGNSQKQSRTLFRIFSQQISDDNLKDDKQTHGRRGIDPKYFKPKFIYHELMTIWGTTYTVITWGSVWVIGGTIVATERLAQKIKTKCTKEQQQQQQGINRASFSSNKKNSSFSSFESFSDEESNSNRRSFKRMTHYTKKSFASAKKKFNKFFATKLPQLTASNDAA